MPYKIYPCPNYKYYEQENNKCFCNNVGLFGYRKELKEEGQVSPLLPHRSGFGRSFF